MEKRKSSKTEEGSQIPRKRQRVQPSEPVANLHSYKRSFIQPDIIKYLQNILEQYPDNGQILKELVQNAEDAGAREVKLLYDSRQWKTKHLIHPSLKEFQGPALYAYNDACFTEEDWEGIRMVGESTKAKDPLKVGRFGLGFKSVFHLTDLPSIVCRKRLGIYDPCQYSCAACWEIDRVVASEELCDQFEVYKNSLFELDQSKLYTDDYNRTLFRFPLRQNPSTISDTVYDKARIENLFQMFQNEGHLMLTFLKNLEKIRLYIDKQEIFRVQIARESSEQLRIDRKKFLHNLKIGKPCHMINFVGIETHNTDQELNQNKWLVFQYFAGADALSVELDKSFEEEKNIPIVGIAFMVGSGKEISYTDGHVFCALPLPVQETCITGLPFHVNGTFAVDQSRDHIKSPCADENMELCMDKGVLWNQYLLTNILPKALVKFVREAIYLQCDNKLAVSDIYRLVPNISFITQHWKAIEGPFFTELFTEIPIFHSDAMTKQKWFKWNEVLLVHGDNKFAYDVLTKIMVADNKYVTDVVPHICDAFRSFHPSLKLEEVRHPIAIAALRKHQKLQPCNSLNREERYIMLKYLLQCSKFQDLHDLELIPLSKSSFGTFGSSTRYYMPLREEDQKEFQLLQKFADIFVDRICLAERDLLADFEEIINMPANQQIISLKPDIWANLIHKIFPTNQLKRHEMTWTPGCHGHPSKQLIQYVWKYLQEYFPDKLPTQIEELHLLVVDGNKLVRISRKSPVVLSTWNGHLLDPQIRSLLHKVNIIVCNEIPDYITMHTDIWDLYIHQPTSNGILRALYSIGEHSVDRLRYDVITASERQKLEDMFLADLPDTHFNFLKLLPIFTTHSTEHFVSVQEVQTALPLDFGCIELPVNLPCDFLPPPYGSRKKLYKNLGVRVINMKSVIVEFVMPSVRNNKYTKKEINTFGLHVLDNVEKYTSFGWDAESNLQDLQFIETMPEIFKSPTQLLNPDDTLVKQLFHKKIVLPCFTYQRLTVLKRVGLRGADALSENEVLMALEAVQRDSEKSSAFMELLEKHPRYIHIVKKKTSQWVVPESKPKSSTHGYPPSLTWRGSMKTCSPNIIYNLTYKELVGAIHPLIDIRKFPKLTRAFLWDRLPEVVDVVKQLQLITGKYRKKKKVPTATLR